MNDVLLYSPKKKVVDYFLCGPIPLKWLASASKLNGKTLNTAILCWFFYYLNKKVQGFKIQHKFLKLFGIHRTGFYHALKKLELAGLIQVERKSGNISTITIIIEQKGETKIVTKEGNF